LWDVGQEWLCLWGGKSLPLDKTAEVWYTSLESGKSQQVGVLFTLVIFHYVCGGMLMGSLDLRQKIRLKAVQMLEADSSALTAYQRDRAASEIADLLCNQVSEAKMKSPQFVEILHSAVEKISAKSHQKTSKIKQNEINEAVEMTAPTGPGTTVLCKSPCVFATMRDVTGTGVCSLPQVRLSQPQDSMNSGPVSCLFFRRSPEIEYFEPIPVDNGDTLY